VARPAPAASHARGNLISCADTGGVPPSSTGTTRLSPVTNSPLHPTRRAGRLRSVNEVVVVPPNEAESYEQAPETTTFTAAEAPH